MSRYLGARRRVKVGVWGADNEDWQCKRSCRVIVFFCQAEDGIRDAQVSRGLGDVYKRQVPFKSGR